MSAAMEKVWLVRRCRGGETGEWWPEHNAAQVALLEGNPNFEVVLMERSPAGLPVARSEQEAQRDAELREALLSERVGEAAKARLESIRSENTCDGEPTNPEFFGRGSEDDRAGADGYCRGCWVCTDTEEIVDEVLLAAVNALGSSTSSRDEAREQEAQRVGERPEYLRDWPTETNAKGGRTRFGMFVESLRWALGYIDARHKFADDRPDDPDEDEDWLEHAAALDLLKDADIVAATQPKQHCGGSGEDGAALIAAERRRQVEQEGWTPEHDAEHDCGELVEAAICYLRPGHHVDTPGDPPPGWPWEKLWWKPSGTEPAEYIRDLAKAGALIAAEIDRVQGRAS